jgi:hypothetical protein
MTQESHWASHQPLIKSIMEFYKPKFVLELGIGNFSTPELIKDTDYLGIENDSNWIETIKNKFKNLNIIHHDLGKEVEISTKYKSLSEDQINKFIKFYDNIHIPSVSPKLLFVDHFTSVRTISLNTLGNKFDIIIYHDSEEPNGVQWYNYDLLSLNQFKKYHLKSDVVWTTLLIKELDFKIIDLIDKNIKDYKNKYTDVSNMKFE